MTEQKLPFQIHFNIQVFGEKHQHAIHESDHTGCDVHGSGFVPLDEAAAIRAGQPVQIQTHPNESLVVSCSRLKNRFPSLNRKSSSA